MSNREALDEVRKTIEGILKSCSAEGIPFLNPGEREEVFARRILSLETDTCRIAVVRKGGVLPLKTDEPRPYSDYMRGQLDMLSNGYVQEEAGVYRKVKYFDGCFIRLECGHLVWEGTPEFSEWWGFADASSSTYNYEKRQVARCIECQKEASDDKP